MTTGTLILILLAFLLLNAGLLWYFLGRKKEDGGETQGFLLIQNQMQEMRQEMGESTRHQSTESQRLIKDTSEQMVRHLMEVQKSQVENIEATKQVFSLAGKLEDLEKVLKHQKQRGNLGEASLELILSNILPATVYKMQYQFEDGDIVDAVIMTKEGTISVDAKFSLDNYNRIVNEKDETRRAQYEKDFKNDLKKRIDETAKYIKPKEGTLPFAFMFIPAEGIYYDLLVNEIGAVKVNTRSLIDYAYKDKNVIIVSPTTFAAYLQSVLYGFRAFKIEESAKEIGKNVESLSRHLKVYDDNFKKVGNSLITTVNNYDKAQKEFKKIDKDVARITGDSMEVETLSLDRPEREE